ncbi:MAG: T9SS type A sorting domain-containing protein [Ignavibacteria bacterium]|jgi:hypothetical protein
MNFLYKIYFVSIALSIFLLSGVSFSQITIDSSDIPSTTGTDLINCEGYNAIGFDIESTGEDYFWDFSLADTLQGDTTTQQLLDPAQSIFDDVNLIVFRDWEFPPGFHNLRKAHLNLTQNYLIFRAFELYMNPQISDSTTIVFEPGVPLLQFPLNYQSQWSGTYTRKTYQGGVLTDSILVHYDMEIDGWGEVAIPNGNYDCLRLKTISAQWIDSTSSWDVFDSAYTWLSKSIPVVFQVIETHTDPATGIRYGQFLYYSPNPVPADPEDEDIIPGKFELSQNYPNPFNPSTIIKYQIPEASFVSVNVYDLLGNEIATLVNEDKTAGSYEVKFDGSSLSSGIYFYRLSAGDFSLSKKMILLR